MLLKIAQLFYYAAILCISFDILGVIKIGFNFRISQFLLMIPIGYACIKGIYLKKTVLPYSFAFLLLWAFFIFLFIPNTGFIARNIAYALWLAFNILTIWATVEIFTTKKDIERVIQWYIYSFGIIGIAGLAQFLLPLAGLPSFLVTQWWIPGKLPRINGFSYEPSFFATYMTLGFILSGNYITRSPRHDRSYTVIFIIIVLAMLLSTSRLGWLIMALWAAQYPIRLLWRIIIARKINLQYGRYTTIILSIMMIIALFIAGIGYKNMNFLLIGTGVMDNSNHSVSVRTNEMRDTAAIFMESPLIGYSLGGISWAIGKLHGINVSSLDAAKMNEGTSIFIQVLAASGIIGFIPFAIYLFSIIRIPLAMAKRMQSNIKIQIQLKGMAIALLFELIILQFNQNILRPYLWLHIALLSALVARAKVEA